MIPSFEIERSLLSPSSSDLIRGSGSDRDPRVKPEGDSYVGGIVGIDEAGCGPWAGPVVVACVVFDPERYDEVQSLKLLNDSKKLSAKKREFAFAWIKKNATYGIAAASVREIDCLNIAGATALATHRAWKRLVAQGRGNITSVIIDGIRNPKLPLPTHMIIEGDAKSCSIAAASILAKVTRDHLMGLLGKRYPGYGFERNAGYGTKLHQEGLRDHGITAHHRLSYAPIKKLLAQAAA